MILTVTERARADRRAQIRAAAVFRPVGLIDAVVDRPADRLESDFPCHPRGRDPARPLPERRLTPARVAPVVGTHIKAVVNRDGPNPGWSAVRHPVLAEQ